MKIISHDYHRNGIAGEGFEVAVFETDEGRFLGILLSEWAGEQLGAIPCFVLKMDLLKEENIKFFENSWRGDQFACELRPALKALKAKE